MSVRRGLLFVGCVASAAFSCRGGVERIYDDGPPGNTDGGGVVLADGAAGYLVRGTVSGLQGGNLILQNNGGDDLPLEPGATSFAFHTPLAHGSSYFVTVSRQPTNPTQTCVVDQAGGVVANGDVTTVKVSCTTDVHTLSVDVKGLPLPSGGAPKIKNGTDEIALSTSQKYTFATPVPSGGRYSVVMSVEPPFGRCEVVGGDGVMLDQDVTLHVTCRASEYEDFPNQTLPSGWGPLIYTGGNNWTAHPAVPGASAYTWVAGCCGYETGNDSSLPSKDYDIQSSTARLIMWHSYDTELGHDGGVVEISIGGGSFQNVTDECTFGPNPYTRVIDAETSLKGKSAFTGNSAGFVRTVINLPARAAGQKVKFRWHYASDNAVNSKGWTLDAVQVDI